MALSDSQKATLSRIANQSFVPKSTQAKFGVADKADAPANSLARLQAQETVDTGVGTSDSVRQEENSTFGSIKRLMEDQQNDAVKGLEDVQRQNEDLIFDRMKELETFRREEVQGIRSDFAEQERGLEQTQKSERGQFSAGLARMGGYLGGSASSMGAMVNLNREFNAELGSLETKRSEAIRAANQAYAEQRFDLASTLVEDARQAANDINTLRQNYFNNQLSMAQEDRYREESDREFAVQQAETQLAMFVESGVTPSAAELQDLAETTGLSAFVLQEAIEAKQASLELTRSAERTAQELDIIKTLLSVPKGTYVEINGKVYEGLADPSGGGGSGSNRFGIDPDKTISRTFANDFNLPAFMIGTSELEFFESLYSKNPPEWWLDWYFNTKSGTLAKHFRDAQDYYFEDFGHGVQLNVIPADGIETHIANEAVYDAYYDWQEYSVNALYDTDEDDDEDPLSPSEGIDF